MLLGAPTFQRVPVGEASRPAVVHTRGWDLHGRDFPATPNESQPTSSRAWSGQTSALSSRGPSVRDTVDAGFVWIPGFHFLLDHYRVGQRREVMRLGFPLGTPLKTRQHPTSSQSSTPTGKTWAAAQIGAADAESSWVCVCVCVCMVGACNTLLFSCTVLGRTGPWHQPRRCV